jgi:hypothetical protein
MLWSSGFLDTLVAPGFTKFREVVIPDLASEHPQAAHWLDNFFLNSALRASFRHPVHQVVLGYLRRASQAFVVYHDARGATQLYLATQDPNRAPVQAYYRVLTLWEDFVLEVAIAIELYNWFSRPERAFEKNDASPEQRLYSIANHVKHVASCADSGQLSEQDIVPLWLSNRGLESLKTYVTFAEAGGVLHDIAAIADILQDPKAAVRTSDA